MCIQRNKVRFLTDVEEKHTPVPEAVVTHVKQSVSAQGRTRQKQKGRNPAGKYKKASLSQNQLLVSDDRDG